MQETTPASDVVIGIDTHKQTHTAVALSAIGAYLGILRSRQNPKILGRDDTEVV